MNLRHTAHGETLWIKMKTRNNHKKSQAMEILMTFVCIVVDIR